MATLRDLVSVISKVTKVPEATVFAYGRFAREQGHISQKGRGRGAAPMTSRDAANLLIAIGGTAVTREAGTAVKTFRALRGGFSAGDSRGAKVMMAWLKPVGWRRTKSLYSWQYQLNVNFGEFLEFLIDRGSELNSVLRTIPVLAEAGSATNMFLEMGGVPAEIIVERGIRDVPDGLRKSLPAPRFKDPTDILVGVDVGITLRFNRTMRQVTVDVGKPSAQHGVFGMVFQDNSNESFGDFEVEAKLTEVSVAAAAECLVGRQLPRKPKHFGDIRAHLFPSIFESGNR